MEKLFVCVSLYIYLYRWREITHRRLFDNSEHAQDDDAGLWNWNLYDTRVGIAS